MLINNFTEVGNFNVFDKNCERSTTTITSKHEVLVIEKLLESAQNDSDVKFQANHLKDILSPK